jgi:beta-galactosidase
MFAKPEKTLWNDDWQFTMKGLNTPFSEIDGEENWYNVEIPHDWLIWDTRKLYETGDGWYKKDFKISSEDLDKSIELTFDGVYMDCVVYINGEEVFEWKYGYTSFSFEIRKFVKEGYNTVHVQVRHEAPNTRWYSGAGIYRNVWLTKQNRSHIVSDGVYIISRPKRNLWKTRVQAEYTGETSIIRYTVLDAEGNCAAHAETLGDYIFEFGSPNLWTLRSPYLYTLKTELVKDGKVVDAVFNKFGFRTINFTRENGFMFNERKLKLHGVCLHHDLGALGAAFNVNALRRQLEIMKSMGVNAVRTSHNPPAPQLISLCDEMGLLVMNEAFDVWDEAKNEKDYSRFFREWYKKDVASWIRRDRNHPCVVMWSIGNEIHDTHESERGLKTAAELTAEISKHDPYCNAITTIASNYMEWENAQKVGDFIKIAGYNYGERLYDEHYENNPERVIYGSETVSCVRSRGVYHFPIDNNILTHDDGQCSDLGNSLPGYASSNEAAWVADRDRGWCGGQFIWTGTDYIGEPTPYGTKNSYFGAVDTAGLPKASYYFYKAVWSDSEPFIKLFPHWDWNEGQFIDVITYSNMGKVELFLNGESLGRRIVDLMNDDVLHAYWRVKYRKGELVAKAYDGDGDIAAVDRAVSFGDTARLKADCDFGVMCANGTDLKYITVSALDENGEFVANARDRVRVKVSGAARLVGFDNGDSTDYDSYKGDNRRLFSGQAVFIIQSCLWGGKAEVEISAKGVNGVKLNFDVLPCEKPVGVRVPAKNLYTGYVQPFKDEIPVRKIQLKADRTELDEKEPVAVVTAEIFPANADYKEIEWTCVNYSGEAVQIAEVVGDSKGATVTAKGIGSFRLRAFCRNGGDIPQVISELEMLSDGFGGR